MENQLMLVMGNIKISWFAVFVVLACLAGMAVATALRKIQHKDVSDVFKCVSLSVPLGIVFGRVNYLIFAGSSMNGLSDCLNVTNGGFGLYGVVLGVFLSALIVNYYLGCDGRLGELLDCLSVGGALAVTIGRFATCFTPSEVGYVVNFKAFTVYDSKQDIYNLAVYQFDGMYELLITGLSLWFFFYSRKDFSSASRSGKTALLMLALHGTNQVVMDSMRADPLKLGINEFIKSSQIIGIATYVFILVYLMVITAKRTGFGKFHIISIPTIAIAIVLGVFGEYRVGSSNYISNHLIMFVGMLILDWIVIMFAMSSLIVSDYRVPDSDEDSKAPKENHGVSQRAQATDRQSSQRVPMTNRQPAQRVPMTDRQPVQRVPMTNRQPAQRVPMTDRQPAQRVPTTDRQPTQRIPTTDRQPAQRVPMTDRQPAQRIRPQGNPPASPAYSPTDASRKSDSSQTDGVSNRPTRFRSR